MADMPGQLSFRATVAVVLVFSLAIAYLEAAVVVYLTGALGGEVGVLFPLLPADETGNLIAIEVGREAATLVIIATVGILVGRTWLERLAWSAVVFGVWDIGYYACLYVFAGWPPSLDTVDLLFLIPVPWVGPIWSPIAVSVALVGFGLAAARQLRAGQHLTVKAWHWAAGLAGGFLVILGYTLDAARIIDGGLPGPYPWPLFVAGMLLAIVAAIDVLRRGATDQLTTSRSRPPSLAS